MKNWRKTLVNQEITLESAIKVMTEEALQIILVVEEDEKLIGMITDGDIRRALLNRRTLESSVREIMNPDPISVTQNWPVKKIQKLMQDKSLMHIPVLNDQGQVIELHTFYELLQHASYDNPIFIMAGGFGTRLQPLTNSCPKPMLKIGDKPILESIINRFIQSGFSKFYISTHYMPEIIMDYFGNGEKWGVEINYVYEDAPLGTGGALGLLPDDLPDLPVIMMNGDILTNVEFSKLLEFHNENSSDLTMCVREYEYQIPYGVVQNEGVRISSIQEKPINRFFVNAGIYVIGRDIIKSVEKDKYIDMPGLIEDEIALEKQVLMFPIHEYWMDIGRMDDFKQAQVDILTLEQYV